MIHLLLLIGTAGASSSASIEEKSFGGVATGAPVEIDTPGRALAAGKCCKRAAKHKRKKLQLKMKWQECEAAAAAPAEVSGAADAACTVADAADAGAYKKISEITVADAADAGAYKKISEIMVADASDKGDYTSNDVVAANYVPKAEVETCATCATVETCGEPEEGKQFKYDFVTASTACGDLCATACFEDKTCGDPEDGKQFKWEMDHGDLVERTAQTACGTTCETTCFEEKGSRASGIPCYQDDDCASGFCEIYDCRMGKAMLCA